MKKYLWIPLVVLLTLALFAPQQARSDVTYGRTASFVIAAQDSQPQEKQADYVVGSYAHDTIQQVLSAMSTTGGKIYFASGTYLFGNQVTISGINDLEITGSKGAVLKLANQSIATLTANAPAGSTTIQVNSVANFFPEMWVCLVDNNSHTVGENRVQSINGNTITLGFPINSDMTIDQQAKIYGGGLIFRTSHTQVNNISIHDLEFDMNASGYTNFPSYVLADLCGFMQAFRSGLGGEGYSFERNYVHDSYAYPVSWHSVKNGKVNFNTFKNTGGGVNFEDCTNFMQANYNVMINLLNRKTGIAAGSLSGLGAYYEAIGNIIETQRPANGIFFCDYIQGAMIAKNQIKGAETGIQMGQNPQNMGLVQIVSNIVRSCYLGIGISAHGTLVANNTIYGHGGSDSNCGISLYGDRLKVTGNLVYNTMKQAIRNCVGADNNEITNNTAYDCNLINGDFAAYEVLGGINTRLNYNTAYDTRNPKLHRYGARISAGSIGTSLIGNDLSRNLAPYLDQGTNSVVNGNY